MLNKRVSRTNADLELVIVQALYNQSTQTIVQVTADQMIVFVKFSAELLNEKFTETDKLFNINKRLIGDHGEILDAQFCNKDENLLAMATNNEFLKIYNLNTWDCKLLRGHTDLIVCLSLLSNLQSLCLISFLNYLSSNIFMIFYSNLVLRQILFLYFQF